VSSPATSASEPSVEDELVKILAARSKPAVVAYVLLVLLMCLGTSLSGTSPVLAATICCVAAGLSSIRLITTRSLVAAPHARVWRVAFVATTLAAGAGWAAFVTVMLAATTSVRDELVVLLPTAGLAAGAANSLAPNPRLAAAYLVTILVPAAVALGTVGDRQGVAVALSFVLFLGFLVGQARRSQRELVDGLRSRALLAARACELEIAQRRAESASATKSQFLANMSHELRTPLTAVLGFADLLQDAAVTADERISHAETIRRSAEHLLGLINDVLDLSKVEAGEMRMDPAACDPRRLLHDLESAMRPLATQRGISVRFEGFAMLPASVTTDRNRLRQILTNVIGNAIKFTSRGEVCVTASTVVAGDASTQLRFDVVDTGIGISSAQAARLFEPFVQADASTSRRFGGTGLGLSIARKLARALGGDITLASELGKGSTFSISVDAGRTVAASAEHDEVETGHHVVKPASRLVGARVLVADDNPANRMLFRAFLEAEGATVEVAEDGNAAVAAARSASRPYTVVLMDMQMPFLDGAGATAQLRAAAYGAPILALTAHAMVGDEARFTAAGCDGYIAKPVARMALVNAVARWLAREPAPSGVSLVEPLEPLVSELIVEPDLIPIVRLYLGTLPAILAALGAAAVAGDVGKLTSLAHVQAGTGGGCGYPTITESARALEQKLRAGASVEETRGEVLALETECRRALAGASMLDEVTNAA
jgi:signal transduction histidine kinase/CheY-like chemotaxis protein/HPt (histidine-containing phosphotransfer) domain-containing protein